MQHNQNIGIVDTMLYFLYTTSYANWTFIVSVAVPVLTTLVV